MHKLAHSKIARLALLFLIASCTTGDPHWNQSYGNSRNSSFAPAHTSDFTTENWQTTLWSTPTPNPNAEVYYSPSAPVVAPDGSVVVSGSRGRYTDPVDGRLACVEPSGAVRFSIAIGQGLQSTPAVTSDGRIVVVTMESDRGAPNGKGKHAPAMYCVDLSGKTLWFADLCLSTTIGAVGDRMAASSPKVLAGTPDTIFVVVSDDTSVHLCAFDINGKLLDSHEAFGPPAAAGANGANWLSPPAVAASHAMNKGGPMVFLSTDGTELEGYSWDTGPRTIGGYRAANGKNVFGPSGVTAPVVSASGELLIAELQRLSAYSNPARNPDWSCYFPFFTLAPQPPALYFDGSNYNFYLTIGNNLCLVQSCSTLGTQVVGGASPPVVTWDRVHVSGTEGLHTFDFSLSAGSHVVAPVNISNRAVSQPAVAPDGTLYECVMDFHDGKYWAYLRAFGGSGTPRPNG